MSDDKLLQPEATPNTFEGKGVQRLNKLPLLIFGGIIFIVVVALAYAMHLKGQKQEAKGEEEAEQVTDSDSTPGLQKLLATAPDVAVLDVPREPVPVVEASREAVEPLPMVEDLPAVESETERLAREAALAEAERKHKLLLKAMAAGTDVGYSGAGTQGSGGADEATTRKNPWVNPVLSRGGDAVSNTLLDQLQQTALAGFNQGEDANGQAGKRDFLSQDVEYSYSGEMRRAQVTSTEIRAGWMIPAVLIGGVNTDLPGEIIAQVREDVYDSATGRFVLIPKGSRLIGQYDSEVSDGQMRVLVAWYRVNFPDGSALNLKGFAGTDQQGYAGLSDAVNNHTVSTFKNATLLSLLGAAGQLSQSGEDESSQQLAAELGRQWSEVGAAMVEKKMERQPTLTIRPGYRFNIFVKEDLILKPYQPLEPLTRG